MIRLRPGTPRAERQNLRGRRILVTGAGPNSLGEATAAVLASWGAEVIVTRTRGADAEARAIIDRVGGRVHGVDLDQSDADSTHAAAERIGELFDGRLDVLVANAGIMRDLSGVWTSPRLATDGHEIHWRTNFLGTTHLAGLLRPHLEASAEETGDARIVSVSSLMHRHAQPHAVGSGVIDPYHSRSAYGTSKLALAAWTAEHRRRDPEGRIAAMALSPGAVRTGIEDKGLRERPVLNAVRRALTPIEWAVLLTPAEGAQTQIMCASAPDLPRTVGGSFWYERCGPTAPDPASIDPEVGRRAWAAAAEFTGAG